MGERSINDRIKLSNSENIDSKFSVSSRCNRDMLKKVFKDLGRQVFIQKISTTFEITKIL